jgi:endonuclease/exonuclease/phosphatase family metal-dependent hydrolase
MDMNNIKNITSFYGEDAKETNISYFFRLLKENFCYNGKVDNDIMIDFREGFRVMTFNIRRDAPGDGENNWQHRRDAAVKAIAKYAPDVICFQECMPTMAKYLIYRLSKYYDNAGVEIFTGREMRKSNLVFGEGLLTMWRKDLFDFKYKKVVKLFDGRWINLRRFMDVGLIVKATGQQVNIINTHFCHKSKEAQNKSYEKLKDYVSKLNRFYACGDYNSDKTYRNTKINLMMDDYSYNYKKKSSDTTITSYGRNNKTGQVIDYIFSNNELKDFEILCETDPYISDHNPVVNVYDNI